MRKPNIRVVVKGSVEKAIKIFKRKCDNAGIRKELKNRRYYEKPSDTRRKELRKAERNRLKQLRRSPKH